MIDPQKRYGFLRAEEADLIDRLLVTIKEQFNSVSFLEIGVFGGGTVSGIVRRCKEIGCPVTAAGVDFLPWKPSPAPLPDYDFHDSDSMDAFRGMTGPYNFLFVDGCHCVNHAMCDFLNYSPLVVLNGYCLFHDTALPKDGVTQGDWPQDHSYAGKPPSVLGVRDGLKKLGLLQDFAKTGNWSKKFQVIRA
jgi:hypothetical protein